ncbi:MAG TPA: PilX N-terminal domain-containing pilus assembly protein [Burkholderiaceae bacterium]|nr:PilX N-terminal domain-containing pilus assembly protein [Burkholderiaceae bacterium]
MQNRLVANAERGVVLPLALVMLVMVTLIAVIALRSVTSEERISANLRASSVAFEQAELSLRFCEQIALVGGAPLNDARIDSTSTVGLAWRDPNNWKTTNTKLQQPPPAQYQYSMRQVSPPACLIEAVRAPLDPTVASTRVDNSAYTVTARGFGDTGGGFRTTVQTQLRPPPL